MNFGTEIQWLLEAIDRYGLASVLAVLLFLTWFMPQIRRIRQGIDQVRDKDAIRQGRFRRAIRDKIFIDSRINLALDHLVHDLGCDRAYVVQYHNGGENVCGIPFAKCSRTHERVQMGARALIGHMQNMPNSLFAACNLRIIEQREIACPDIEALRSKDPLGIYVSFREQGIRSFYLVGIFSFDRIPVGFVGIDYCRAARKLSELEKDKLRTTALKICGLVLPGWERREEGVCALPQASVPREIVE